MPKDRRHITLALVKVISQLSPSPSTASVATSGLVAMMTKPLPGPIITIAAAVAGCSCGTTCVCTPAIRCRRSGSGSRIASTAFRGLKTTDRGALELPIARILAAAALVVALITAGAELPIAQRVLEVATRGNYTISSNRGVYATKSRDPHVRSIGIG
jgi:hypothetical protein